MDTSYILKSGNVEVKRLALQALLFEKETMHTLKLAGIKPGMNCIDLGCGIGDVSLMMAELVGPDGTVIGLDANSDLIKACEKRASEQNVNNAKFLCGSVYDTGLGEGTFDFVFSRFLFQHLKEPKSAVKEMIRIASVDGTVAAEENDHGSWISYPELPQFETLRQLYVNLLKLGGCDELIARKLYKIFFDAGLNPQVAAYSMCVPMNREPFNKIGIMIAEVLKPKILALGIVSEKEFNDLILAAKHYIEDPSGIALYALTFRVWGKKQ